MNPKLKKIIRDVAIGALVGIAPHGKADAGIISASLDDRLSLLSNNDHDIATEKPIAKLTYAFNYATNDGMFHRSHRSHSSHQSHYSSSTRSTSPSPSTGTSTGTSTKTNVNNINRLVDQNQNSQVINNTSTLGSRNLSKGMQGNDVLELKKALVIAKFYKMGEYEVLDDIFDQKTVEAVNSFKKSKGLSEDGRVDAVVIVHLKNIER
jgi:murein L,D-transpeptidase YcbB/YkuD